MKPLEWRYPSPAKINLGLRILGKRPDGYHAIETIFQMLDLCDWLTFRMNSVGSIRLTCSTPSLPTDAGNLVRRAARLLQRAGEVQQGVDIHLDKRIPLASGLGGGSSNAATTLLALNRLWGLNWGVARLQRDTAQLGSDVPFFLDGPTALAHGRGEELTPLPPPPSLVGVLVNPGFGVPAGWAYSQFSGRSSATDESIPAILRALQRHDLESLAHTLVNDLEPGVAAVYPVICEMEDALRSVGARAAFMAGSGPTVCGIFHDAPDVHRVVTLLAAEREWLAVPFATISESPLTKLQG